MKKLETDIVKVLGIKPESILNITEEHSIIKEAF